MSLSSTVALRPFFWFKTGLSSSIHNTTFGTFLADKETNRIPAFNFSFLLKAYKRDFLRRKILFQGGPE